MLDSPDHQDLSVGAIHQGPSVLAPRELGSLMVFFLRAWYFELVTLSPASQLA
jgi:hypothetical protein